MGKQRKKWPTETKEQIVLAVLGGQLSVAEAARQHEVNKSLIHTLKAQFLEAGRARLAGDHHGERQPELERENERPKALVGEKELALHIAVVPSTPMPTVKGRLTVLGVTREDIGEAGEGEAGGHTQGRVLGRSEALCGAVRPRTLSVRPAQNLGGLERRAA